MVLLSHHGHDLRRRNDPGCSVNRVLKQGAGSDKRAVLFRLLTAQPALYEWPHALTFTPSENN
jgi:hypothetical protein